jgi:anti-sigma regulatory factor (Ser/Thr protein kinase)
MKPAAGTHSRALFPAQNLPGTATAPGYASTFPGHASQLSQVRREIASYLDNCPAAADIILIASELAANAILHSQSRGGTFTIRCQLSPRAARIEAEDLGGPWRPRQPGDRPHGLDIIAALTGPGQWGTKTTGTGGRTVWARVTW